MGIDAPIAKLQSIQRSMESLSSPNGAANKTILRGIKQQVIILLKNQFSTSTGPDGQGWDPTKRGDPALSSNKMIGMFALEIGEGSVTGIGSSKRDLLTAHQEGHVFPARKVAAQKQFLTFGKRGQIVKTGRILNKKGGVKKGYYQRYAAAHVVSSRVLPARPMIPTGSELPPTWSAAVKAGVSVGMQWWAEKMSR
jgi:hypothetical protein